jgi:hypothetical protein
VRFNAQNADSRSVFFALAREAPARRQSD